MYARIVGRTTFVRGKKYLKENWQLPTNTLEKRCPRKGIYCELFYGEYLLEKSYSLDKKLL